MYHSIELVLVDLNVIFYWILLIIRFLPTKNWNKYTKINDRIEEIKIEIWRNRF